jgi:hypothetical protein
MWHLLPDADLASTLARSLVVINRGDQTAHETSSASVMSGTDARAHDPSLAFVLPGSAFTQNCARKLQIGPGFGACWWPALYSQEMTG